jgi:hypothetical protein
VTIVDHNFPVVGLSACSGGELNDIDVLALCNGDSEWRPEVSSWAGILSIGDASHDTDTVNFD